MLAIASVLLAASAVTGLSIARQRAQANRIAAAHAEHPGALVVPIVVAAATGAATRWIAARTSTPGARLDPDGEAVVGVDRRGLHLVGRLGRGFVPADAVVDVAVGSTRHGWGSARPAVIVRVRLGDEVAPVPLLPSRARRRAGEPRDARIAELVLDIRAALRGDTPIEP